MRSRNDGAESDMPTLASATLPDLRKNLRFIIIASETPASPGLIQQPSSPDPTARAVSTTHHASLLKCLPPEESSNTHPSPSPAHHSSSQDCLSFPAHD